MKFLSGLLFLGSTVFSLFAEPNASLLLHVKFDGESASGFRDSVSGQKIEAHSVAVIPGVDGYGINFLFDYKAGIVSRVEIPITPKLHGMDTSNFSFELWLSPDEIRHAMLLLSDGPFNIRWRLDQRMWFELTADDGESRLCQTPPGGIRTITFPKPTWRHFFATYDGQTAIIYIDGELKIRRPWKEKKRLRPFKNAMTMGGRGWERYTGGVDELAIYGRAFSAEEVKAHFESQRKRFKSAPQAPRKVPGTLNGAAYKKDWRKVPLKSGSIELSNTGQLTIISRNPRWGRPNNVGTLSISNSNGMKESYWKELDGRIVIEQGGKCTMDLEGISYRGLGVRQQVKITPEDEIQFRFALWPEGRKAPSPTITWPFHLWYSAMPFVSFDRGGDKIKGRMIDLADTFAFSRELEVTYVNGGNRLWTRLPKDWVYIVPATREPTRWLGGYATFYARMESEKWLGWQSASKEQPYVLEFSLKLTPDDRPPILSEDRAREITPEMPFDFSELYQPDASKVYLEPIGRDVPIFSYKEDVEFRIHLTTPVEKQLPSCEYTVTDAYSGKTITRAKLSVEKRWWEFNANVVFTPPSPSVYLISLKCRTAEGKIIAELEQEVAVAGPIEQPAAKFGEELNLKLIDEVDCTKPAEGHAYYSRSNRAKVIDTPAGKCLQTLDNKEMARLGTNDLDWFGYRFNLKNPSKTHVVEVIYPDIHDLTMGINVFEPGEGRYEGGSEARARVLSGVSTGGVYPVTNRMQRFRTIYFPGAPWCAVAVSNIHCGSLKDGPGAAAASIRIYEVEGKLPQLPNDGPGKDRLIGIYTESGELGMGAYGYGKLRGEFWSGFGIPKSHFFRAYYRAIENQIRYMRYRGDTVYIYGAYRYRSSRFPSVDFPPAYGVLDGDLLALMARMFEHNGLKVIPAVQANQPLPVSRYFRCSLYDIVQGKKTSVSQVNSKGATTAGHFGYMYTNPYHPLTRKVWAKLAAELGRRYGDYPAVAGIAWLTGSLWSPALLQMGYRLSEDKADSYYFGYTYDDATMRQFADEEKLSLPGKIGDPKRFQQRYEWIMKNAKEKWTAFRCRKLAALYKGLAAAMKSTAPRQTFFMLGQHPGFLNNAIIASPKETWRMCGFDPRAYAGVKDFVYVSCVPDGSGLNIYEHGSMPREWMDRVKPFVRDPELFGEIETLPRTGRFLHRQFFENRMRFDPKRPWVFARGQSASEPTKLTHNFYPQPGGRNNLEDFAWMMALGAPELIAWMWCDGSVPFGNEETLRELAAAYRALPIGKYETVSSEGGVFVRKLKRMWKGAGILYVVNTNRTAIDVKVQTAGSALTDMVTGESFAAKGNECRISLLAAQTRVFKEAAGNQPSR